MSTKAKFQKEMKTVGALIGKLQTRDQVVRALRYRQYFRNREEETWKHQALHTYIARNLDKVRAWAEILLVEILGEMSEYLLPNQDLDAECVDELSAIARYYVCVSGRNAVPRPEPDGVEDMQDDDGDTQQTCAAKLKSYLEAYRRRNQVNLWSIDRLIAVSSILFEALEASTMQQRQNDRNQVDTPPSEGSIREGIDNGRVQDERPEGQQQPAEDEDEDPRMNMLDDLDLRSRAGRTASLASRALGWTDPSFPALEQIESTVDTGDEPSQGTTRTLRLAPQSMKKAVVKKSKKCHITREHLMKVHEYLEDFSDRKEELFREKNYDAYLKADYPSDFKRFYEEYNTFLLLGQLPAYFLPGVKVDESVGAQFYSLAHNFVALAGLNGLSLLEPDSAAASRDSIANNKGTCTEKLKKYLQRYQTSDNFELSNMVRIRHAVFQALKKARERPGLAEQPDEVRAQEIVSSVESDAASSIAVVQSPSQASAATGRIRQDGSVEQRQQSAIIKPEAYDTDSSINEISPELNDHINALQALVGNITTLKQIERTSKYLDDLRCDDEEDSVKTEAWQLYSTSGKVDFERAWWYLDFWRLMKDVPSSVVAFDEVKERNLFSELNLLCQRWASLAANGGLESLTKHPDVKAVKEHGGTAAEVLAAYLEVHRQGEGFETWTQSRMSDVRIKVIQLWKKHQPKPAKSAPKSVQLNDSHTKRSNSPGEDSSAKRSRLSSNSPGPIPLFSTNTRAPSKASLHDYEVIDLDTDSD